MSDASTPVPAGAVNQTNPIADIVNGVVAAAFSGGEAAVEAYLILEVPFLGSPIPRAILNEVIGLVGDDLSQDAQLNLADYLILDFQKYREASVLSKVMFKLNAAQVAGGDTSVQDQAALDAWSNTIKWDGAGTPTK